MRALLLLAAFSSALTAALSAAPAAAQVNTEKMRIAEDVEGFTATARASLNFRTGNRDVFELGLGGRADYRGAGFASFLTGNVLFSEAEGRTFLNQGFAHLRTIFRPIDARLRPEVFVQTESNESQLLTRRYLAGGGVRLTLVRDSTVASFLGSTPMLEYELLDRDRVAIDAETTVGRWSNYLVVQVELTDVLTLVNTVYAQPRFDRPGDLRILDEAGLDVQITESLALRVTLHLRYDSAPPADLERFDLALRNGLALDF
jgi:hypothetical protein